MEGRKRNILYVIGWPLGHGGHIHSTLNHVKYLISSGHHIFVLAPYGPKFSEFEAVGAKCFKMPQSYSFIVFTLLYFLIFKRIDVIHAMDYEALKKSIWTKLIFNRLFIFTKAGGTFPTYKTPPVDSIIVFSGELYDFYKKTLTQKINLFLIKERVDVELFKPKAAILNKNKRIVFMAMRLEKQKKGWLENILDQIRLEYKKLTDFQFVFAGSGMLLEYFIQKSCKINETAGIELVRFIGNIDDVNEIVDWYNSSDVVIGHGRGIIEAMSCNKDVIILGENNELELVTNENVEEISYYNFSGRHFRFREIKTSDSLVNCLNKCMPANNWNSDYVLNNYNAEAGAQKISDIFKVPKQKWNRIRILKWLLIRN